MRFWGRNSLYDPDFGAPGWRPEAWGGGEPCLVAAPQGGIEIFLKRFRDGRWVRSYREARVVAGEDGSPRLELGELQEAPGRAAGGQLP
ncbi:hypothetical protein [Meiothermus luteus]|jgi:hypothetical protein|uniref:hypothetical protein n=1 Tax=Meiothermus luteus TaxID=2026184 RepID=UPI0011C3BA82|nr:hypothetical protein [Meiothermus luteus]